MKTVIIGGVAGGMSAATRLRRLQEDADIIVFERGEFVSFANCGLPYYAGGVITDRSALLLQTPQSLNRRFRIDVRTKHDVQSIDPVTKKVLVNNLVTGEKFEETYDALVLSPGASPFIPDIEGKELLHTVRSVPDIDHISQELSKAQTAVVMGAGFIGVEMAENLIKRGLKVAMVELADQVLAPLDPEMAIMIEKQLRDHDVKLYLGRQVSSVTPGQAKLDDGTVLSADLVICAIGVVPESVLAKQAGLAIGARGGVVVDDQQRTSAPDIYAVGDAVEKRDLIDGHPTLLPLANPANRQGRLVADVISGRDVSTAPAVGTAIVGVFGLAAAVVGWNEKRLKQANKPYIALHNHPINHAGYYPGAQSMSLKLLIDQESGRILGAQGVGIDGVDKRIDVIATAMRGDLTAPELADLELCYAPQYGSAKDPVNMLGYMADNVLSGEQTFQWHQIEQLQVPLIDVRTAQEFSRGSIPGAINIPVDELRDRIDEVPQDIAVHCQVGLRGHIATRILAGRGKNVTNLDGGYKTWQAAQPLRERRKES